MECPCCREKKEFTFDTLVQLQNFISKWDNTDKYTDMTTSSSYYRHTKTDYNSFRGTD